MDKRKAFLLIPLVIVLAFVSVMFKGLRRTQSKETASFFSMDTYVTLMQYGGFTDRTTSVVTDCADSLDMYSGSLMEFNLGTHTDDEHIFSCTEKVLALNNQYGYAIDITSGALTELWGISGDNPQIPDESEIAAALDTIGTDKIEMSSSGEVKKPVETKLDFGAVAKGYACDEAYENFSFSQVSCAVISFGSSSLLYGQKPDGSKFTVEIRNPEGGDIPLGVLETGNCFISTSGGYERFFEADGKKYCHILDLSTGYPSESDLTSVTVITKGEDGGIKSDFLSTHIFLGGTKELESHLTADDYKIIAVDTTGKVYISDGLDFTLTEGNGYSL